MMTAEKMDGEIRLSALLQGIAACPGSIDPQIEALALDSRMVASGTLFIALRGTKVDAAQFIDDALGRSAAAVVWEDNSPGMELRNGVPVIAVPGLRRQVGVIAGRFYGEPSRSLRVIGITGTNGKTSCTHFLAQCLSAESTCGVVGTLGNGLLGHLSEGSHTTPDAVSVHGLLAQFVAQRTAYVVMEVSSHGLEQDRVVGVHFDTGVFTNLSRDHLDYHGDMQAYGAAKRRLFNMPGLRHAVVNADDAFGRELLAKPNADVNYTSYGLDKTAVEPTVRGYDLELGSSGLSLQVASPWGNGLIQAPLVGRFNASNLLAVFSTLLVLGMPFDLARQRIAQLRPVPGRMERFGGDNGVPTVIVDYAHSPDALEQVLMALRDVLEQSGSDGRLWCVFGCGGDRDRGKRPLMGEVASRLAEFVVVTDDNPRREPGDTIVADIMSGIKRRNGVEVQRDRARAIHDVIAEAAAEDIVLVAGKGHEHYQIIGEQRLPFDDSEQVRRALAPRMEGGR